MPDITTLQQGVRVIAATCDALVEALVARRLEVKRAADERRPPHARGRLSDVADGIWSKTTVDAVRRLGAVGVQLNGIGAELPPDQACPCCGRPKGDLVFASSDGVAIAQAVEHHDHFVGYVNQAFHRELGHRWSRDFPGAAEAQRRLAADVVAFDQVVICKPCNFAEGQAKAALRRRAGLGKDFLDHFSFAPDEIRRFVRPSRNAHHRIDEDAVLAVFGEKRKREVVKFRKGAVDTEARLLKDGVHWCSPGAPAQDALAVREAHDDAVLEFGMEEGANFSLARLSATDQGLKIDPDAWITAAPKRGGLVLDGEAEAFLERDPDAAELGPDWRCPCCGRSIRAALRRNGKRKLGLQPRQVRPGGGDGQKVCIDCHTSMIQLTGSAGSERDDILFEAVREVYAFRRNERHRARSVHTARAVVERVRDRAFAAREAEAAALEAQRAALEAARSAARRPVRRLPGRAGLY